MRTVLALAFADWRAAVNEARRVRRSPRRLVIWLCYGGLLSWIGWSRATARNGFSATDGGNSADYLVGALLLTLALSFAAGWGAVGIFRTRAEARFIVGSPVPAPLAIAYLQTRESLGQGLRVLASLAYALFFFAPRQIGLAAMLADIVLIGAVVAASNAVVVPRRLLPARWGRVCALAGIPLVLLVLAPMLRDAVVALHVSGPPAELVRAYAPNWHPGRILFEPRPAAFVVAVVVIALGVGALAALGRDAYPELYALALVRIDGPQLRARRQAGVARPAARRATAATPVVIGPSRGAAAFFWKSMLAFRRAQRWWVAGGAVAWCALGFGLAQAARNDRGGLLAVVLMFAGIAVLVVFGGVSTNSLDRELRNPLFWLAPMPFFERLVSLGVAEIWRVVLTLEIIAAGFAAGGGTAAGILAFGVGFPALVALLTGSGFAFFAFFPSAADQRGPVAAFRLVASMLVTLPALIAAGIGAVLGVPLVGLCAAVLMAVVETGALLGVAAARLDGRMDRVSG